MIYLSVSESYFEEPIIFLLCKYSEYFVFDGKNIAKENKLKP